MAKVYTMGELERARKKAQIREWVQDKKDKATNWCWRSAGAAKSSNALW